MAIDKLIYLAILSVVGIFVFRKMINPARGPRYHLKTILFVMGVKEIPKKKQSLADTYLHQRSKENGFCLGNLMYGSRMICLKMGLS